MTTEQLARRTAALKTADAINAIEGVPVSDYAKTLSFCWARGVDRPPDETSSTGLSSAAGPRSIRPCLIPISMKRSLF